MLLRVAASLSLLTFVGHTIGTFMPLPPEQVQMHTTVTSMKATMVPMPVGSPRSYMQLLDGNNLCTSLLMLLCAMLLFTLAREASSRVVDRVIGITALALAGVSILSLLYFFPVPAAFTGLAAALSLIALRARTAARA